MPSFPVSSGAFLSPRLNGMLNVLLVVAYEGLNLSLMSLSFTSECLLPSMPRNGGVRR